MASTKLELNRHLGFLTINFSDFLFIEGRSTVMQFLEVMGMWTESLESGGRIDLSYYLDG